MPFHKLVQGFGKFHSKYFLEKKELFETLSTVGQSPEVLVIACSDSRNDPALITKSEPGDIFVVRNVAAIVPPYQPDSQYHGTSAAIEFAIKGLKVKDIVIMGHAQCGGVEALRKGTEDSPNDYEFLRTWISIGKAARDTVLKELKDSSPEKQQSVLERAMILTSLNNLMTFPWIKSAVTAGQLTLHGWYFDLSKGKMFNLNFTSGEFEDMSQTTLASAFLKRSTHCCDCSIEKFIENHKGD